MLWKLLNTDQLWNNLEKDHRYVNFLLVYAHTSLLYILCIKIYILHLHCMLEFSKDKYPGNLILAFTMAAHAKISTTVSISVV
jgi:hypothetical protein